MMKAIVCTQYGTPEHLVMKQVTKPMPKADEVLIRIHATSVTASDVLIRSMNQPLILKFVLQMVFGFGKPRNPILGMVVAGKVESIGKEVTKFQAGDEVFAYGSVSPMKRRFGSYAEYISLPQDWNLATKPANLSYEEAAAIPYGGLLAFSLLSRSNVKPGSKVLIYGASGSIGTMLIQLAKHAGATVTSVCSARNFAMVTSLGSDKVIDYTQNQAENLLGIYDVVFDAVGNTKSSVLKEKSKQALTPKGKYLSIDEGTPQTPKEAFIQLKELAEQGKLTPVIDRTYPLAQMAEAHQYVELGHKRGNVVVSV